MDKNCHSCKKETRWYKEKLFIILSILFAIQIIHFIFDYLGITILHNLLISFYECIGLIWLPILVGFLLGGIIDYFIPREYIIKYLAQHRKRTILNAVGLGFLMSACSHGILAISVEIYKKGASTPAVIAFLLASPWANLPITILLFGLFGVKALLFVSFAIIIALITGFIYQLLDKRGLIECSTNKLDKEFSILEDIKKRFKNYKFNLQNLKKDFIGVLKGSWELTKMVLWWILIGTFLASVARTYVPPHFFMNFLGATLLGLIITLILATILEICSEGTAPLAFEIYRQTKAFGNSFVFLMAGVATDYTEIGLIWSNIGKRVALWLPIITVPQILILGYLFNILI